MAFKILVAEGTSPLGVGLLNSFEAEKHSVICPDIPMQDWGNEEWLKKYLLDVRPAIFINTLLISQPSLSLDNSGIYRVISSVCAMLDIVVIHISSHEVFPSDQDQERAMEEKDIPHPNTSIGELFYLVEQYFAANKRCIILRLPWVVDFPDGILHRMLSQLVYSKTIDVSNASRGCLVSTTDVLRTIVALTQQILCDSRNWGVAHVKSSDVCSELEFVDYLQRVLNKAGCDTATVNFVDFEYRFIHSNAWLGGSVCANGFGIQFLSWRLGLKSKIVQWLDREVSERRLILRDVK